MASSTLDDVRESFKKTMVAFLRQIDAIEPSESHYAFLFEISDQEPGAWPICATEESLARKANSDLKKGYTVGNGDPYELLRIASRWDAPGDDPDIWYWAKDEISQELNSLLTQSFKPFEDYRRLRDLALTALKELEAEKVFGQGDARDQIVVGISNVDQGFNGRFLEVLATVNPANVIDRLKTEIKAGQAAWDVIETSRRW